MPKLTELIGQTVCMRSLSLHDEKPQMAKIVAIEEGGLWVECQAKTDEMLEWLKTSAAKQTPVFFLPYSHISWIMWFSETTAISEKSFGL